MNFRFENSNAHRAADCGEKCDSAPLPELGLQTPSYWMGDMAYPLRSVRYAFMAGFAIGESALSPWASGGS